MRRNKLLVTTAAFIALATVGRIVDVVWDSAMIVGLAQADSQTRESPSEEAEPTKAETAAVPAPQECPPANPALLTILAEERAALEERERRAAEREAFAAAAEVRARIEIEHLTEVRAGLEALAKERADMQNADLQRMAKMYSLMKPKDAARILSGLDNMAIVGVLDQMNERESAPILAELPGQKAEAVSRVLIERRALPGDRPGISSKD